MKELTKLEDRVRQWQPHVQKLQPEKTRNFIIVVASFWVGLILVIGLGWLDIFTWEGLRLLLFSKTAKIICAALVLIVGRGFYSLKKNHQLSYACIELAAAAATAFKGAHEISNWKVPSSGPEHLAGLLAVLGALYIAVRGYTNLAESLRERSLDGGQQS